MSLYIIIVNNNVIMHHHRNEKRHEMSENKCEISITGLQLIYNVISRKKKTSRSNVIKYELNA